MKPSLKELFDTLIAQQEEKLLDHARQIIPNATSDDILQPNDFPALENHPFFRYEEGLLKGLHAAKMAVMAWERE